MAVASSRDAFPVSDALLNPTRKRAVSLGWVRWYGEYGQLVLAPVFPFGGEWGGHLIFYFTSGRVSYAVTLHAWMAALRLPGADHRVLRYQSGPALPHVIATLKAMVGSALGRVPHTSRRNTMASAPIRTSCARSPRTPRPSTRARMKTICLRLTSEPGKDALAVSGTR